MTKFAPVLLFVYNRIETTKQTIIHLKNNTLAHETDLFIYSDGGKDKKSWKQVNMLRQYLRTISGFKNVFLVERRINYYLERNIIDGVTDIINHYGRVIVIEDDVLTNPYYLQYMNDVLTFYEKEKRVMHISSIPHFSIRTDGQRGKIDGITLNIIQIGKTLWMVSQRKIYIELNMEDIFNV